MFALPSPLQRAQPGDKSFLVRRAPRAAAACSKPSPSRLGRLPSLGAGRKVPLEGGFLHKSVQLAGSQWGKGETICPPAASSAALTTPSVKSDAVWEGAKPMPLAITLAIGLMIRFLLPVPDGVTSQAWSLLSIFVSTIAGLVLEPLPTGGVAFLALTIAVLSGTLTFPQATAAMTSETIWLIVVSFFFAKGFEITGLGQRVALLFVRLFGKSTLGLSYGLNFAEGVISPAMPSTTARAGGIFLPIMKSISENAGSMPEEESRHKIGAFLLHSQFQTSSHTSALFLTAAAQNLLCLKLAADVIGPINNAFATWLVGGLVPAFLGLFLTPLLIYKLCPPEIKQTPDAPKEAAKQLQGMGPMSRNEVIMSATMLLAVSLWVFGDAIGVSSVLAAMLGLSILLTTGVLKWQQCLNYSPAWDTFFWFAVLIGLSSQLSSMGLISAFADKCGAFLTSLKLGWQPVFVILQLVFFFIHYMFASQTAHVGALYAAVLTLMVSAGTPPLLAAMSLAYTANLFGSITQFASGQAAVYVGVGYMSLKEVFKIGAICGVFNVVLWLTLGPIWWKILGWW